MDRLDRHSRPTVSAVRTRHRHELLSRVFRKMIAFVCIAVIVLAIAFPNVSLPILGVSLLSLPAIVLAALCYLFCKKRLLRNHFLMLVLGYYLIVSMLLVVGTPSAINDLSYMGGRTSVVGFLLGLPAAPLSLVFDWLQYSLMNETSTRFVASLAPRTRISIACAAYALAAMLQWTLCTLLMRRWRLRDGTLLTSTLQVSPRRSDR